MIKKWRKTLIAIAMVLALGILSGCGGSSESSTSGDANVASSDTTASAEAKNSYAVGETYEDRNVKITFVSVNDDFRDVQDYMDIPSGKKIVQATFNFENVGSSDITVGSWDYKCFADNESCEEFIWVDDSSFSDTLSAGRQASGRNVYFAVPENATNIVLEYEPDFWSSKKIEFVVK